MRHNSQLKPVGKCFTRFLHQNSMSRVNVSIFLKSLPFKVFTYCRCDHIHAILWQICVTDLNPFRNLHGEIFHSYMKFCKFLLKWLDFRLLNKSKCDHTITIQIICADLMGKTIYILWKQVQDKRTTFFYHVRHSTCTGKRLDRIWARQWLFNFSVCEEAHWSLPRGSLMLAEGLQGCDLSRELLGPLTSSRWEMWTLPLTLDYVNEAYD